MVTLVKGERQNIESIPARLLAPDKGVENFISELQEKVQQLKKKNRNLQESNTKLKEKSKTAGRGVLPRYLNKKTIKVPQPAVPIPPAAEPVQVQSATVGTSPRTVQFTNVHTSPRVATPLISSPREAAATRTASPPPFSLDPSGNRSNQSYIQVQSLQQGDLGNINKSEFPFQQHYPDNDVRISQLMASSEATIQEKSAVISHLESLVVALKDKLIESEQAILDQRDAAITMSVERDTAIKNRDIAYRERDLLISERDHAVSLKIKMEKSTGSLEQEVSALQQDRTRLRDEFDALSERHRKERSRWESNENTRLETLDSLSKTLKEKTAALVILDNKYRDLEDKSAKLTSTNLDMLQEMESLHHQLNRHRISQRDQELQLIRLQSETEATTAGVDQYNQLREEYLTLQKEHSIAVDKILQTRNITEQQVRSEHVDEVADLKRKIVKWEGASKTQFLQHQKDIIRIQQMEEKLTTAETQSAQLRTQLDEAKGEVDLHKQKISLLLQAKAADGSESVLDDSNLRDVIAALELVKRSQGMKTMTDMVKEFTKEEREDLLITQKDEIDSLKRELKIVTSNNKQLRAQLETLAQSADDHIARAGTRLNEIQKTQQTNQRESEAILSVQAAQISSLTRAMQRGGKQASVTSTLTLDTDVGDDNILQITFGVCQFMTKLKTETVTASLDFFTFETVATVDSFRTSESGPDQPVFNFDTQFIFRLSESDYPDLQRYLTSHNSTIGVTSENGSIHVGDSLLCCSQLLGLQNRVSCTGRVAIRDSSNPGKVIAFLDVSLRLKKPLPEEWIDRQFIDTQLDGIKQEAVVPAVMSVGKQVELKNNLEAVVGIKVEVTDISLRTAAKISMYCCVCGVDVWFLQAEGTETKNPTITPSTHLQPIPPPSTSDDFALLQQPIPFVIFDDTEQNTTDCLGSATFSPLSLLQGAHCKAAGPVQFLNSSHVDVGTMYVKITWMLKDE
eukprot:TRINITY_DN16189_c0_g2_i1.p1 TRINITY_DN16189_c0_g2~~TRINITY_DN16189_c0_g2_i1.p1  ORF type:complete len:1039 (+),score=240.55 TRINITY_DN16189_c0_g2_i1:213-3119(+)